MKRITILIAISALLAFAGCNTSSKTSTKEYDASGKVVVKETETKTSESAAVMQAMAPAISACEDGMLQRRKEAIANTRQSPVPALNAEQLLALKTGKAQDTYIDKAFTYGIVSQMGEQTKLIVAAFKKPPITCAQAVAMAVDSYMEKEGIQAEQWGSTGLALAIAMPTAWVIKTAMNTMDNAIAGQGDQFGNVNVQATKSDDPYGGEGGAGGDVNGSQAINIGSGSLATDHAQIPTSVDKNINTGFASKSSSNQDNNTEGPNVINDENDGSDNQFGF